jgi:ABC-type transport system involved in multi-copper enzyme maturation permease subunit
MAYLYSWFVIFLCVFAIISISNEFSYRTNRQHIIDGMERLDFLHAKALLILSISLSATLFFLFSGLLFGFINGGGNPFDNIEKVGFVFVYTLNYLSFAAMLAFFIKRSGLSIMLLFAYFLIESIFSGLINWKFNTYIGNLLFLQCSDELLPLQALKAIGSLTGGSKPEAPVSLLVSCSLAYIAIYYFVLRKRMLTADL